MRTIEDIPESPFSRVTETGFVIQRTSFCVTKILHLRQSLLVYSLRKAAAVPDRVGMLLSGIRHSYSVSTKLIDVAFYEGQLKSVEFFVHCVLPVTLGKMDAILATNSAVVEIEEDSFGGK